MAANFGLLQTITNMLSKILHKISKCERNIFKLANKSINGCKSDLNNFERHEVMFKEYFGEAAQNNTTCDVQELGAENLRSNVQKPFEHNKNYQMIPNPNNNTSNFINSCEDYTEKVTLIEKDKIINKKD